MTRSSITQCLAVVLLATSAAQADVLTYSATANRGVRESSPNGGFGLEVRVDESAGQRRWSYFKFTITGNPCNLGVISVRLYANGSEDGLPVALHPASDTTWTESALTWNNKPAIGPNAVGQATVNDAEGYYVWDVTNYVRSEYLAGRSTVTLVAKGPVSPPAGARTVNIADRGSATPPQLAVNTEPLVPGCMNTVAPLGDTFARSSSPDQNFGNRNELELRFPGSSTWGYVKVALPALGNGVVASARIRFRGKANQATAVVSLYGVSDTSWAEGTLTWNNKPSPEANALGSLIVSDASSQWYEWDVTQYVRARIQAGHPAASFALKIEPGKEVNFDSRETGSHGPVFLVSVDDPVYYIHVDHLNTPRLVANQSGQAVWRWDQQEPFGVSVPDEDPSARGALEFPLRFPGQYFDKETNLHYNYFRDYDAATGRFLQGDPIGLEGRLNIYAYTSSQPLGFADALGLQSDPSFGLGYSEGPVLAPSFFTMATFAAAQGGYSPQTAAQAGSLFQTFTAPAVMVAGSPYPIALGAISAPGVPSTWSCVAPLVYKAKIISKAVDLALKGAPPDTLPQPPPPTPPAIFKAVPTAPKSPPGSKPVP
jgi:RHS repeat-associated protein